MDLDKRRRQPPLSVDITPLIDVVLLILIFVLLAARFAEESSLNIKLPTATTQQQTQSGTQRLVYELNENNQHSLNGWPIPDASSSKIAAAITSALEGREPGDIAMFLRADRASEHGEVVKVLNASALIGIKGVSFAVLDADVE